MLWGFLINVGAIHQDVPVFSKKKQQRDAVENTGSAARYHVSVRENGLSRLGREEYGGCVVPGSVAVGEN
jgi:hypothetical protein